MKKFTIIIFLMLLGIVFALCPIQFNDNLKLYAGYSDDIDFDYKNVKLSKVSGKIHIDNNWTDARDAGICTGNGIYSDPYIIEDLVIDGEGSGSCILIENSDVYFKIESCIVYNSGTNWDDAGIKLYQTANGYMINNDCSSNSNGVFLNMYCVNNTILGNTISNNKWLAGIEIVNQCENNTILGNTINNYNSIGIVIELSNNNNILENDVSNNENGIWVLECTNTMVSGNTVNNNDYNGIYLHYCYNIMVSGNIINNNNYRGLNLDHTDGSSIFLNCFTNNALNAYDEGINNQWDNGSKGNYWDDYTGLDEDGDGIGDTPYNIFEGSQDNFPLMKCPIPSQEGGGIPGYNLFFLLGILVVTIIILSKKLKNY